MLDDAGQYDNQSGPGWRLVSTPQRFPTLGEKRNAAAALVGDDVEALAVWDDDDLYLPWACRPRRRRLRRAAWSRPSLVLHPQADGSLRQHQTGGLFHGGWAYRRDAVPACRRLPGRSNNGEDQALARRLLGSRRRAGRPLRAGLPALLHLLLERRRAGTCRAWAAKAIGGSAHCGPRRRGSKSCRPAASISTVRESFPAFSPECFEDRWEAYFIYAGKV